MRTVIRGLLLLSLLTLTSCDPFSQPTSLLDEYLERVGRVLDQPVHYSELPEVPAYPRRRDLRLEPPEINLGLLDFLSLYGCELQEVIGEKASGLGRVMQPGRRLNYELRFIAAGRLCLPKIEDEKLAKTLRQAIAAKRQSLPITFWNATWGSEEMARFFSRSNGPLPLAPDGALVANLQSDLNRLLNHHKRLNRSTLPTSVVGIADTYQRWQARSYAGQLIQSARRLTARLNDAATVIEQRMKRRPLCFQGRSNHKAEIMRNVFFKVYAKRVQPYMATVQRVRQNLVPLLAQLAEVQTTVMPEAFEPLYRQVLKQDVAGSLWQQLDAATQRHTRQWQALLEQCGMRPQA
ncbi:DUF3080 domain-containing protein [Marinobacteraceae bacterium S3BR75-40.1]